MTITGSIGSISGKFNMKGLYDKLGITYDFVTKGPMALLWSDYRDFTNEEWERFTETHWNYFNTWLNSVAEHRGLTVEDAEKLAHGRVWTGRQAKKNGLVDEVGGLARAIEIAKELADISAEDKVTIVHLPEEKGVLEMILGGGGNINAAARWIIYKFIHEDVSQTLRNFSDRPLQMLEDTAIE